MRMRKVACVLAAAMALAACSSTVDGGAQAADGGGSEAVQQSAPRSAPATSTTGTSHTRATETGAAPETTAKRHGGGSAPTLGTVWGPAQSGYGQVRPSAITSGAAAGMGHVADITWQSWGADQARGTGTAQWLPPGTPTVDAVATEATLVAYDLGECEGQRAYRKLEWFFPSHGGSFDPAAGMDICGDTAGGNGSSGDDGQGGHGGNGGDGPTPFAGKTVAWSYSWDGSRQRADFTSPSGSFACGIVSHGWGTGGGAKAQCQGNTSPVPPRPGWCAPQTGWGGGMVVRAGGDVTFLCAGDVENDPAAPALPYGEQISAYGFTCASHRDGVYCREDSSGHGFMIARGDNERF